MRPGGIDVRDISIVAVDRLDVTYAPCRWAFADERRSEIDSHFAHLQRERPALWNGRVLMLRNCRFEDGVFRGACAEVDYASFLSWQDWGFPDRDVRDCFAMGMIRSRDGAYLLGVMGAHTFNAGQIYFPCGTPDLSDIVDGKLDFAGSMAREIAEETGLAIGEFDIAPGWLAVLAGPAIAHARLLQSRASADDLRARILDHCAREREPELAGVRVVREPDDLDPMVPPFVTALLRHAWEHLS